MNSRPGAAVPAREAHSLPEAGPAGAAQRQSCREMKSEPAQLGLQGRISVPINNSGIPWGRGDGFISHPFPIATLAVPFPLSHHSSAFRELGTPWDHVGLPPKMMSPRNRIPSPCLPEVWSASSTQGKRRNPGNYFLPPAFPWIVWSFQNGFTESVRAVWCCLFLGRTVGKKIEKGPRRILSRIKGLNFTIGKEGSCSME